MKTKDETVTEQTTKKPQLTPSSHDNPTDYPINLITPYENLNNQEHSSITPPPKLTSRITSIQTTQPLFRTLPTPPPHLYSHAQIRASCIIPTHTLHIHTAYTSSSHTPSTYILIVPTHTLHIHTHRPHTHPPHTHTAYTSSSVCGFCVCLPG